jgi:hypothetical protein
LKRSRERVGNESAASKEEFAIRLPAHVVDWIVDEARRKVRAPGELVEEIVTRIVENEEEPSEDRLRRVNRQINDLVALANNMLAQEMEEMGQVRVAATLPPAFDERKKKRDRLVGLAMEAYEELRKILTSEQAAKEAEWRMKAYLVMARVGAFNAAVITDQETEDLSELIIELEEKNRQMGEEVEKLKKRREMEGEAEARTRGPTRTKE